MIKIFLILVLFGNAKDDQNCIDALVNKAFIPTYKSNYFLFLPVKTTDGFGRLMITKENLRKYMIALDSSFINNDILKKYVAKQLNNNQNFFFNELGYKTSFGKKEYKIFYKKNRLEYFSKKNRLLFLKKYLTNYNEKDDYFNFNTGVPTKDVWLAFEQLFHLGFLVAEGDGFTAVYRVKCYR